MPYSSANNPTRWRECAEECRVFAEQISDREAKSAMLEVAAAYERLAEQMDDRRPAP